MGLKKPSSQAIRTVFALLSKLMNNVNELHVTSYAENDFFLFSNCELHVGKRREWLVGIFDMISFVKDIISTCSFNHSDDCPHGK